MLKVLLFDLDNTLIPEDHGWNNAFDVACAGFARERGLDLLTLRKAVFDAAAALWLASPHSDLCDALGLGSPSSLSTDCPGVNPAYGVLRAWLPAYVAQSWRDGLATMGIEDPAICSSLAERYVVERRRHHRPYDSVIDVLERLSANHRLAVVSNGFGDLQRQKLHASELGRYFEAAFISGEVGFGKPDPRIFQAALEGLGVRASEALIIGDSLTRDIAGALAAGVACIWLRGSQDDSLVAPSIPRIDDLGELEGILKSIFLG